MGCSWCDTKHTWTESSQFEVDPELVLAKTQESEQWFFTTAEQLLAIFAQQGYVAKHIIITGGEPCIYDLSELTGFLIEKGFSVQIETSGTFEVQAHPDTWVTVSPKVNMKGGYRVLDQALSVASEIKHPVAMEKHIQELEALLSRGKHKDDVLVYLQPISQMQRATQLAVDTCIQKNWRLSLQTHKFIGIE